MRRSKGRLASAVHAAEKAVIDRALRTNKGAVGKSAVWLGVSRRALYQKIRQFDLGPLAAELRVKARTKGDN